MADINEDVQAAMLAEQSERFEDMVKFVKKFSVAKGNLTKEERNLLSVAYKNVVGARRSSWRAIHSIEEQTTDEANKVAAGKYREIIEVELRQQCQEVLDLINDCIMPKTDSSQSKVFFLKMKGDYYRYLAEVAAGDDRTDVVEKSHKSYQEALDVSKKELASTDPIRLGLALNYSVFYYEILNSSEDATRLAKQAFDDAIADIDTVGEDTYNDATLIMQLLKDNLVMWNASIAEKDDDEE